MFHTVYLIYVICCMSSFDMVFDTLYMISFLTMFYFVYMIQILYIYMFYNVSIYFIRYFLIIHKMCV